MTYIRANLSLFIGIILVSFLIFFGFGVFVSNHSTSRAAYHRPTILLTGYGAGSDTFDAMISRAEVKKDSQATVIATIHQNSVSYQGKWHPSDKHPMIKVVFADNKMSWMDNAKWLNRLLSSLKQKYGIKTFNAIAHSRGSLDLLVAYGEKHPLKLKRAVFVGAAANGHLGQDDKIGQNYFLKNGQPKYKHQAYADITKHKQDFPKGTHVLNLYGNVGNGSDTHVTNVSSQSLYPALGSRFASYQQKMIKGKYVSHHWIIRKNGQVRKLALNYIWRSNN